MQILLADDAAMMTETMKCLESWMPLHLPSRHKTEAE